MTSPTQLTNQGIDLAAMRLGSYSLNDESTSTHLFVGLESNRIYNMDCLEGMKLIADASINMILCDLPYGTTACPWDSIIPLEPLWEQYRRIIKSNGAVVLTGSQPFTTTLVLSNLKWFKYECIWEKPRASSFYHARNKPLKCHENIIVFSPGTTVHEGQSKKRMTYNPQMTTGIPYVSNRKKLHKTKVSHAPANCQHEYMGTVVSNIGTRFPRSIQEFCNDSAQIHPTQKPVALFEYLIRTYSNPGDLVLDNCIGSGTTAVASLNTGRNYIGFETDPGYYEAAMKRVAKHTELMLGQTA